MLLVLGNIFMILYAIFALVSATILIIQIFKSQEYKDKKYIKKMVLSMEKQNPTPTLFSQK